MSPSVVLQGGLLEIILEWYFPLMFTEEPLRHTMIGACGSGVSSLWI